MGIKEGQSIQQLEERLAARPDSLCFSRLADEYRKTGNVQKAIELCLQGTQQHPAYITGHIVLGRCYLEQEEFEKALTEFKTVCHLDHFNQMAIKMLADIYSKHDAQDKAADLYRILLKMDPGNKNLLHLTRVFKSGKNSTLKEIIGVASEGTASGVQVQPVTPQPEAPQQEIPQPVQPEIQPGQESADIREEAETVVEKPQLAELVNTIETAATQVAEADTAGVVQDQVTFNEVLTTDDQLAGDEIADEIVVDALTQDVISGQQETLPAVHQEGMQSPVPQAAALELEAAEAVATTVAEVPVDPMPETPAPEVSLGMEGFEERSGAEDEVSVPKTGEEALFSTLTGKVDMLTEELNVDTIDFQQELIQADTPEMNDASPDDRHDAEAVNVVDDTEPFEMKKTVAIPAISGASEPPDIHGGESESILELLEEADTAEAGALHNSGKEMLDSDYPIHDALDQVLNAHTDMPADDSIENAFDENAAPLLSESGEVIGVQQARSAADSGFSGDDGKTGAGKEDGEYPLSDKDVLSRLDEMFPQSPDAASAPTKKRKTAETQQVVETTDSTPEPDLEIPPPPGDEAYGKKESAAEEEVPVLDELYTDEDFSKLESVHEIPDEGEVSVDVQSDFYNESGDDVHVSGAAKAHGASQILPDDAAGILGEPSPVTDEAQSGESIQSTDRVPDSQGGDAPVENALEEDEQDREYFDITDTEAPLPSASAVRGIAVKATDIPDDIFDTGERQSDAGDGTVPEMAVTGDGSGSNRKIPEEPVKDEPATTVVHINAEDGNQSGAEDFSRDAARNTETLEDSFFTLKRRLRNIRSEQMKVESRSALSFQRSGEKADAIPDHVLTPTLADIYYQQDQLYLAVQIYRRLLKRNPDSEQISRRIREIEEKIREREDQPFFRQAGTGDMHPETVQPAPPLHRTSPGTGDDGLPLKGIKIKKKVRERIKKVKRTH